MDMPEISPPVLVYENPRQQIYRVTAKFSEFTKEFFVTNFGARVGLVAVKGDCILLVRQYRLLINALSWEIPGGKVDDDEVPEVAAVRECLEETGVRCLNPQRLFLLQPGLDTVANPTHVFYSDTIASGHEPDAIHPHEVAGWEWVSLTRCLEMIFQGHIQDSLSVAGLLGYHAWRETQQFPISQEHGRQCRAKQDGSTS